LDKAVNNSFYAWEIDMEIATPVYQEIKIKGEIQDVETGLSLLDSQAVALVDKESKKQVESVLVYQKYVDKDDKSSSNFLNLLTKFPSQSNFYSSSLIFGNDKAEGLDSIS